MHMHLVPGALLATIALAVAGAPGASASWQDDCDELARAAQPELSGVPVGVEGLCRVLGGASGDVCGVGATLGDGDPCGPLEAAYEEVHIKPIRCELARAHAALSRPALALLGALTAETALAGISDEAAKGNLAVNDAVCPG